MDMVKTYNDRNVILYEIGFTSYSEYLTSPLWASIRLSAYQKHGRECRLCKSKATVLHHTSYCRDTLLGKDLRHLVPLCDGCHKKVEFDECGRKRNLEGVKVAFNKLLNPPTVEVLKAKEQRRKEQAKALEKALKRKAIKYKNMPRCVCGKLRKHNKAMCRACDPTWTVKFRNVSVSK